MPAHSLWSDPNRQIGANARRIPSEIGPLPLHMRGNPFGKLEPLAESPETGDRPFPAYTGWEWGPPSQPRASEPLLKWILTIPYKLASAFQRPDPASPAGLQQLNFPVTPMSLVGWLRCVQTTRLV